MASMSEKLTSANGIASLAVAVLAMFGALMGTLKAVFDYRAAVDSLQVRMDRLEVKQSSENEERRKDGERLDRAVVEIKADIRWIRQYLEHSNHDDAGKR